VKSETNEYVVRKKFTASPDKFMEDNGEVGVSAGVNGGVLLAELPHFPAPCFKGSFKTTFVHFRLHKL